MGDGLVWYGGVVWSGVVWWCVHLRVCKWVMVSQNWPLLPSHCTQRTVSTRLVNEQHHPSNGTNESFHPLRKAMWRSIWRHGKYRIEFIESFKSSQMRPMKVFTLLERKFEEALDLSHQLGRMDCLPWHFLCFKAHILDGRGIPIHRSLGNSQQIANG